MASRLASNITDDYFMCSICCTLFEDPRQTPCEHTFCLKCLKDYGSRCRGKEFVCPICRTVTEIDDHTSISQWIVRLPVDTFLLLIMKTVNSYQNHNPNDSELLNEPDASADTQVCSLHKERQLSIYCNDHDKRLCFECAWQKHPSCECVSIRDESLSLRCEKTKTLVTKYIENVQKLQEKLQVAETVYNEDKRMALSGIEDIQRYLQVFWGKLQMSFQENLQTIHTSSTDLNESKTVVETLKRNLEKCLLKLNSLDQRSTDSKLSILNTINQEIEQTTDILSGFEETSFDYRLNFFADSELMKMLHKFDKVGKLRVTKPCYENQGSNIVGVCSQKGEKGFTKMTEQDRKLSYEPGSNSIDGSTTELVSELCAANNSGTSNNSQLPDDVDNTNGSLVNYTSPDSVDYLQSIDMSRSTDVTLNDLCTLDQPQALGTESLPDCQPDPKSGQPCDSDDIEHLDNCLSNTSFDSSGQLQTQQTITHSMITTRKKKNETATLSGICIAENHVIVVDQYNNCIMRFDCSTKEQKGEITVHEPHKLSLIPKTSEVLLTCWDQSKIYIISTETTFKIHDELQTKRNYIGVCAVDQNRILATATDRAIDLISFKGHVLISINPIQSGVLQNLMYRQNVLLPADIGLLGDDNIIVHDGMKKSILCLSLSGKVKWQRRVKGLSAIRCHRNAIYVSIGTENIVIKLNDKGKVVDSNVLSNFTIRRPWAIDVSGDVIVVCEDSPSSKVHFFTFNM